MITVISGPMFSGKTEFLLHELEEDREANKNLRIDLFTPHTDKRYQTDSGFWEGYVCSRSGDKQKADVLKGFLDIIDCETVYIDEVWMMGALFMKGLTNLSERMEIVVTTLNCFASGEPVPGNDYLFAYASKIYSMNNQCDFCKNPGEMTLDTKPADSNIRIGNDGYKGACISCWQEKKI